MSTLKQPIGLRILFFAELWERFGFYTIQSLLVLYLIKVFLFSDTKAYGLFSAFSALIYTTPVIGGYIADRFLGFRKAIFLGSILYIIGYLLLGIPHNPYFYLALACLIWGNGFFKSCVSSFLGTFYEKDDIRRDSGFTIFYMGINIGSFLAPLICTYIAIQFGWNYGFAAAGIGMIIGLVHCLYGFNRYFPEKGLPPKNSLISKNIVGNIKYQHIFWLIVIGLVALTTYLLHFETVINYSLIVFSALVILYILLLSFAYTGEQRKKLWALIILFLFSIIFWSLYMQTFLSITLFIDRNVDRHFFHWVIPTAMYQSINPFFIIVLSPLFAKLWLYLGKNKKDFSSASKFAVGILFIGLGFLCISFNIKFMSEVGLIAGSWLVWLFFLQTCGELSLSPVGLSVVTVLSPDNLSGMLMGAWFLSLAGAYAIAGKIADLTSIPDHLNTAVNSAAIYYKNFFYFGWFAVIAAIILFALTPFLNKMMRST